MNQLVKEFWKSVHSFHSYYQTSRGIVFLWHSVVAAIVVKSHDWSCNSYMTTRRCAWQVKGRMTGRITIHGWRVPRSPQSCKTARDWLHNRCTTTQDLCTSAAAGFWTWSGTSPRLILIARCPQALKLVARYFWESAICLLTWYISRSMVARQYWALNVTNVDKEKKMTN